MLTHPTLEQLRQLKLDGMADAFAEMSKQDDITDLSPPYSSKAGFPVGSASLRALWARFLVRMVTA
jgi:hypothetical protein